MYFFDEILGLHVGGEGKIAQHEVQHERVRHPSCLAFLTEIRKDDRLLSRGLLCVRHEDCNPLKSSRSYSGKASWFVAPAIARSEIALNLTKSEYPSSGPYAKSDQHESAVCLAAHRFSCNMPAKPCTQISCISRKNSELHGV